MVGSLAGIKRKQRTFKCCNRAPAVKNHHFSQICGYSKSLILLLCSPGQTSSSQFELTCPKSPQFGQSTKTISFQKFTRVKFHIFKTFWKFSRVCTPKPACSTQYDEIQNKSSAKTESIKTKTKADQLRREWIFVWRQNWEGCGVKGRILGNFG